MPRIREVRARALDVPLSSPFGIAGGVQASVANAIVEVVLDDGTVGLGEAAPLPAYNGETQAMALDALGDAGPRLVGDDAAAWRAVSAKLADLPGSARCALETAVLDAWLRARGLSMWAFFGGAERALDTDVTLPTGEGADEAKAWTEKGFSTLKIKVGAATVEDDLARVVRIARAAPSARLLLDGNAGLVAADAARLVRGLRDAGVAIALFEQPVAKDDIAGLRALRSLVPVCADESAVTPGDAFALAGAGAVDAVNVKPMKAGLVAALDLALAAKACGLSLMIGGMVESRVAMGASFALAAGLGGFSFVDLDTPMFFAREVTRGGFVQDGARLSVDEGSPGHGASLV